MAREFPREIIMGILCRLPVKELVWCRPVCKEWSSLIDGPDFIKMHLQYHQTTQNNTNSCVIVSGDRNIFWVDDFHAPKPAARLTNPLGNGVWTDVVGSCNGLLALRNAVNEIAIWNPSTRRFRKLPDIQKGPDLLYVVFGFGHDPRNDDYKLVKAERGEKLMIYSAKSNIWTSHEFPSHYVIYSVLFLQRRNHGVLLNNTLHWLVSLSQEEPTNNRTILSFDLVTEKSHELVLPAKYEENCRGIMDFGVVGGSLCALLDCHREYVDVWVMKEYGVKESWTKMFSVEPLGSLFMPVSLVVSLKNNNGRDGVMFKSMTTLMWYDLETKIAEKMWLFSVNLSKILRIHMVVGSLVGLSDASIDGALGWRQVEEHARENNKSKVVDDIMHERLSFKEVSIPHHWRQCRWAMENRKCQCPRV